MLVSEKNSQHFCESTKLRNNVNISVDSYGCSFSAKAGDIVVDIYAICNHLGEFDGNRRTIAGSQVSVLPWTLTIASH